MSNMHPRPWYASLETTVKERRRDGKRGKTAVEYWAVLDARGMFIAEGLDGETAREIAAGWTKFHDPTAGSAGNANTAEATDAPSTGKLGGQA